MLTLLDPRRIAVEQTHRHHNLNHSGPNTLNPRPFETLLESLNPKPPRSPEEPHHGGSDIQPLPRVEPDGLSA